MKKYIKPTFDAVELRVEERLAGCGDKYRVGSEPGKSINSGCWTGIVPAGKS